LREKPGDNSGRNGDFAEERKGGGGGMIAPRLFTHHKLTSHHRQVPALRA